MKSDIEGTFKALLKTMDDYYSVSAKVSDYYSKGDYKDDISKAVTYDEQLKAAYDSYKSAFNKFSDTVKKYKPKRNVRDPNAISNPDERSLQYL